jgi:hypothetical protein
LDRNGFKNKLEMLYQLTQKVQDVESLDVTPIGVSLNVIFKSFNMHNTNVKDLSDAIAKK